MYQSSADQIPSRRGRSRPQSQSQQSHIEDTLMLKPPGIKHPIRFPFPDRKLPVCATCKRNYKTRELCRTRDGHTSLPWTTTYICITLDASCVNDKGEFRSDAKLVARPVASHKDYCFSGLQTVEVPICLACKEKNYTRQYCREKLKHRQLPWATAFAVLSSIDKNPSDPKPDEVDSKEKGKSEGEPLKIDKDDVSDTPHVATSNKIDVSEEDIKLEDGAELRGPDSRKIGHNSTELNSEGKSDLLGTSGSNKINWQSDSNIKEEDGILKLTEGTKIKLDDVSAKVANVDQNVEIGRHDKQNQELKAKGQCTSKSNALEGTKDETSKKEVKAEEMNIESAPKRTLKLDNSDSDQVDIECEYAQNVEKNMVDVEEAIIDSKLSVTEPGINNDSNEEKRAEEQKIHKDGEPKFNTIDSKTRETSSGEDLSKNKKKTTNPIPSSKQKNEGAVNNPQVTVDTHPITSKRSADSEASCTSPPQKAKIDDGDVTEEKTKSIFGSIHESKAFLAVVSSKSCSFEWLDVNPDRDKSTRSSSRSPVSSPIAHPQNAYGSYPYYPQSHPQHTAGPYYTPHQYDYTRWGGYGYPPAQPYTMPQAHPHWAYYPYYEHDGNPYPLPEHGNPNFGPTPPQHPGNYDHGHPSGHGPNAYSESPHPQYFAHPPSSVTQHNQYPMQQEGLSHDARYQERSQDQYQSQVDQPGSHEQTYPEGTPNVASQPQDQLQQAPPSPRDQGGYYYPSHPNNTTDGGDQWRR